jgi:hypothetical protein
LTAADALYVEARCIYGRRIAAVAADDSAVSNPPVAHDGHLHGYGIIRDVAARTAGGLRLGTGTLYTALARLETLALVEETDPRSRAKDDDERRRVLPVDAARAAPC